MIVFFLCWERGRPRPHFSGSRFALIADGDVRAPSQAVPTLFLTFLDTYLSFLDRANCAAIVYLKHEEICPG